MTVTEFLNSVQPDTSFLSETAQSFYDQSLYVAEAAQVAFNETFQAIGIDELRGLLEADGDATAETTADEKRSILKRIKDFFAKIWAAIKGFFNKVISAIKAYFASRKSDNFKAKFATAVKFFGSEYKGEAISFGKLYKVDPAHIAASAGKSIEVGKKQADDLLDKIKKFDWKKNDKATLKSEFSVATTKKEYKELLKSRFSDKVMDKGDTLRDFIRKAYIRDVNLVEVTTSNLSSYTSLISDNVNSEKKWLDSIKKMYNDCKKAMEKLMSDAKQVVNITPQVTKDYCGAAQAILTQCIVPNVAGYNDAIKATVGSYNKVAKSVLSKYFQLSGKTVKESVALYEESDADKAEDAAEGDKVDDKDATLESAFDWLAEF